MIFHVSHNHLPHISSSIDQHRSSLREPSDFSVESPEKSKSTEKRDQEKRIDHQHGSRIIRDLENPLQENIKQYRAYGHTTDNVSEIPDTSVPPYSFMKPKRDKQQHPNPY